MKYVYILESRSGNHYYVGLTDDVDARLKEHNLKDSAWFTARYQPWRLKTLLAFSDEKRAVDFEQYLKSGFGRAFAKKRL